MGGLEMSLKSRGGHLNEMEKLFGDRLKTVFTISGERDCPSSVACICGRHMDKNYKLNQKSPWFTILTFSIPFTNLPLFSLAE